MIQIHNIVPQFIAFWERAEHCDADEQQKLWKLLYEDKNSSIFTVYYSRWGNSANLETALLRFHNSMSNLNSMASGIEAYVHAIVASSEQVYQFDQGKVAIVLMVGLFGANGWVTDLNGTLTLFLALEKLNRPPYLDIVMAHEVAHILHQQCSGVPWTFTNVGQALFMEGLAVLTSAHIYQHANEAEYLWFDAGYEDWCVTCEQHWPVLQAHIVHDFDSEDIITYGKYFLNNEHTPPDLPFPRRAGYLVGYRCLRILEKTHALTEMVRWSPSQARAAIRSVIEITSLMVE